MKIDIKTVLKSLPKPKPKKRQINFPLDYHIYNKIHDICKVEKVKLGDLFNEILTQFCIGYEAEKEMEDGKN